MTGDRLTRRTFMQSGLAGAGAFVFGAGMARYAFGAPAKTVASPYGALGDFNGNGIALPQGFSSREIARGGQTVGSTGYTFPNVPDGQGVFSTPGGGWYLCTNHEMSPGDGGGVSVIEFNSSGSRVAAQRLLIGSNRNCSTGVTPWGTLLTCEEVIDGVVWECDPANPAASAQRPALGTFQHEAACVDPVREHVYLTEDTPDGCFYRFLFNTYPDLTAGGTLQVAKVAGDNSVTWFNVPSPNQVAPTRTKDQVSGAARFNGGEGMFYDDNVVYFSTKGDRRIWAYDIVGAKLDVIYDLALADSDTPLREVDNIVISNSGDMFICEDGDNFELCLITPDRYISTFARLNPAVHGNPGTNETAGVRFTPDGSRMYVAAQRSFGGGAVYEITGPFRNSRPAAPIVINKPVTTAPTTTTTTTATTPAPPPPPPPLTPRDTVAPRATVKSLVRQTRMGTFLERGLSVQLDINEPAVVELVLRAPGFGVLARSRSSVQLRGLVRLRLRVTRAAFRRRLRRRRVRTLNAELTITLTDAARNRRTFRRTVKLIPPH